VLSEEEAIHVRAMNLDVTCGAILVSQCRLIVEVRSVWRSDFVGVAVTLETELPDMRPSQQFCIR